MGKKAVLVGCNYPGTEAELHGCVNDVWRMHYSLIDRFGFSKRDITVLIDTDEHYTQPTGANIRRALNELVTDSRPGDVLFFHYSGHGVRLPPEIGEYDDTGYDECIAPCDMNLLTDDDFREIVDKVPEGATLTIVSDSCHSGGLIDHSKEQIGDSSKHGGSGGAKLSGLKDFLAQAVHEAFQTRDKSSSSFDHGAGDALHDINHDEDDQKFQQVHYTGAGAVKSRSLPISILLEMLKQLTGKDDVSVGTIRPTLFDMFGEDSSSKVKKFVKLLVEAMQKTNGEGTGGGFLGMVGSLALQFLKQKLDEPGESAEYMRRALEASFAHHSVQAVRTDRGVLLSGCQSNETSADAVPSGGAGNGYGAMSNAIQSVLCEREGPISNRELVMGVRKLLRVQGFSQHPGLYCSDENADSFFIC